MNWRISYLPGGEAHKLRLEAGKFRGKTYLKRGDANLLWAVAIKLRDGTNQLHAEAGLFCGTANMFCG